MDKPANQVVQPTVKQGTSDDTKTLVTVLLMIFVYPVGFILMWVWAKWKTWVKALITAITCLPIILAVLGIIAAGALVAVNPSAQIKKAEYVAKLAECKEQCADEVNPQVCIEKCAPPPVLASPSADLE